MAGIHRSPKRFKLWHSTNESWLAAYKPPIEDVAPTSTFHSPKHCVVVKAQTNDDNGGYMKPRVFRYYGNDSKSVKKVSKTLITRVLRELVGENVKYFEEDIDVNASVMEVCVPDTFKCHYQAVHKLQRHWDVASMLDDDCYSNVFFWKLTLKFRPKNAQPDSGKSPCEIWATSQKAICMVKNCEDLHRLSTFQCKVETREDDEEDDEEEEEEDCYIHDVDPS